MSVSLYEKCSLCNRKCLVDRTKATGFCGATDTPTVSRAALHFWEEPCISGERGSGTIFFDGCSLKCIFCQNKDISRGSFGERVDATALSDIMLKLEEKGAHNINFVTPTHFVPTVIESVRIARGKGLSVPIVYNTGGYDTPEAIRLLKGTVDVFLPDFKYYFKKTAEKYSSAHDYPEAALSSLDEMVNIAGESAFSEDGIMIRGVIVRILLLPSHVAEAKLILSKLYRRYGNRIFYSLMSQYTPLDGMPAPLNRPVTRAEYSELVDYAIRLGVENCFIQDCESADSSFVPDFDLTGVL